MPADDVVGSALREFTEMQRELAEARAEVALLRTASHATTSAVPPTRTVLGSRMSQSGTECLRCSSYSEEVFTAKKTIEQLTCEKRELILQNLVEQSARHGVTQQLVAIGYDKSALEDELRKLTLEKERNERKVNQQLKASNAKPAGNKENFALVL